MLLASSVWAALLRTAGPESAVRHLELLLFLLREAHCRACAPYTPLQAELAWLLTVRRLSASHWGRHQVKDCGRPAGAGASLLFASMTGANE